MAINPEFELSEALESIPHIPEYLSSPDSSGYQKTGLLSSIIRNNYSEELMSRIPISTLTNRKISSIGSSNYMIFKGFDISKQRYEKVKELLNEENKKLDGETMRPYSDIQEELYDKIAFRLVGTEYIEPGEKREGMFFEGKDGQLNDFYHEFARALEDVRTVDVMARKIENPRARGRIDNSSSSTIEPIYEPQTFPEIVPEVEEEKPKKRSWWPYIAFGALIIGAAAAGLAYYNNKNHRNDDKPIDNGEPALRPYGDEDGDYIPNQKEIELGTNPHRIDSDGGGVDDFNEVYTWSLNPNNPKDDEEFIKNLPNVGEARHWELEDGGEGDVAGYSTKKYVEISMRDPYIQWLAERAEIRWETRAGTKYGKFYVNGEEVCKEYGREPRSIDQPSYYFSHERKGNCVISSLANLTVLKSMNLKAVMIDGKIPYNNELTPHGWVEAYIDGEIYVVNFNSIYPREDFYEKNGWKTPDDYNPQWYKYES